MNTYRTAGHALAGPIVSARTIAAARLAHGLAKRAKVEPDKAPGFLDYMNASNAAQTGTGAGIKIFMKSFQIGA